MDYIYSLDSMNTLSKRLMPLVLLAAMLFVGTSSKALAQATQIRIETLANGTGTVVPAQNLASGDSLVVYAISRTATGVFVANVAASTWVLDSLSGGVLSADLVPRADSKSAVLKGHLTGSAYIRATLSLLTQVPSGKITVVAGAAKKLVLTQPPTSTIAGASISPAVTVQIQDALGNNVPTPSPGLAVVAALNTGTGTLSGTTTKRTDTTGLATFSDLSLNLVGSKTLKMTSGTLDSVLSTAFTISAAAAKKLVFIQQPTNDTAGTIITPPITVQVQDTFGNNVATSVSVLMSLGSGTGTLGGTTTQVSSVAGLATFNDLTINLTGSKQMKAKSAGLDSALSTAFTINPAAASRLTIATQPSAAATAGIVFAQQPVIRIEDALGNLITTDNSTTVTAARSTGTGTLQGTTSLIASGGLVSFTNLKHTVANTITIQFTSLPALTPATSTGVVVSPGSASKLMFAQQPTNTVSGSSIAPAPTVQVQDTFSNNVQQAGIPIVMAMTTGTGTLGGTTTQNTGATGLATFGNLSVDLVGTKALTASRTGLTSAASNSFQITVGPPATIVASSGTPQSALVNTAFATIFQATVRDAAGNLITGASVTFTAPTTGARGTFPGSLSTAVVTTDTNGIARAPVFTANTTAGAYTVNATVTGVATPAAYSLTNTPGPPRQISASQGTPQSTQISTAFPVLFQSTVKDTFGNPLSNITVTFTAPSSGATGTFAGGVNTAVTNASGVATAQVFVANIVAGTYTLTSAAPGITVPAQYILTNLPGDPASITPTAGTPQTAQIGTAFATNFRAVVKDGANNPVPGRTVVFTAPAQSGASGTFANNNPIVTDSLGIATAPVFTANTTAGSYEVDASTGVVGPARFLLTNSPGAPGNITVVAGTPQSTTVNTAFATAFQVLVKDGSGNPVSNVTVTFTAPSAGASGKFSGSRTAQAATNASGIATAPAFVADTLAGVYQVTASAPGVLTPALFSLTNAAAPASRVAPTAGTPQSAVVGTVFATNFKVKVTDIYNNPIAGNVVTFIPPANGPSGSFSGNVNNATTDSTGVATAVAFTANFTSGSYTLPANAAGVGTPATFALTNTAGIPNSIGASAGTPQSTIVNTTFPVPLQAIVRDAASNPVPDVTVTFAAPVTGPSGLFSNGQTTFTAVTGANGVASAPLTANGSSGAYSVNATVSGVASAAVFSLTNTPGGAASVTPTAGTPQSAIVNRRYATNLQVVVRDAASNPVPGALVTFAAPTGTIPGGSFPSGASEVDTTNALGVATARFFTANATAGAFTATATVPGVGTSASFALTNLAGTPGTVYASAGTPQSTTVNTPFANQLAVTVKDSFQNVVPNVTVTFTAPLSGASGTFAGGVNIATTNNSGVATAPTFTANTIAGSYLVTGTVSGVTAGAPFNLVNLAGQADTIIASAGTPQSAQVNSAFSTNFRVQVRDHFGNAVRSATVTFNAPGGGASGTFAPPGNTALTDSTGFATATQFTANSVAGQYAVSASVGGVASPAPFLLTNTAGVASAIVVQGGNNQTATVGTQFAAQLQAQVHDQWGNPVPNIVVTFTSPSTGASCSFASTSVGTATTNAQGIASISAVANTISGAYQVTATGTGISTPATFSLANVAALAASIAATAGTPQSAQVGTTFSINLQATVRDALNNTVPNVLVHFVAPAQSGPSGTFQNGVDTVRTGPDGVATARPFTANTTAGGPYAVTASVTGVTTPASFSLTNLTGPPGSITILAGSPDTAQVGTTFPTRFKVQVKDGANNPIAGLTVRWTGGNGSFQGGVDTAVTNTSGIAEANPFIANHTAGSYTVNASAPGAATPVLFQLTNTPGPARQVSASNGTPQSAQVSQAFATNFQATVRDTFGNTVAGVVVTFSAPTTGPSGTFQGGQNTAITGSNGVATANTFVANPVAGSFNVNASIPGVTQTAAFNLTNVPGPASSVLVVSGSGQSVQVRGGYQNLQVKVLDALSNVVPGVLVRFAVPLTGPSAVFQNGIDTTRTDNTGIGTAQPLVANTIAGRFTIHATTGGVSQPADFTLTNLAGVPSSINVTGGTPQTAQVNTAFSAPLQAALRDSFLNPVAGAHVVFVVPGNGASCTFTNGNDIVTNDSGVAVTGTVRANGISGSYVVHGTVQGLTATANYNLTNSPGTVASVTAGTGTTPQAAVVNTYFATPLSVTVTDGSGNALQNITVVFAAPTTGPSGIFPGGNATRNVVTNANGVALADSFKANTVSGSYSVTATVQGATPVAFALTNNVGALGGFTITATGGGNIGTQLAMVPFDVKVTAVDAYSNTVQSFNETANITSTGRLQSGGGLTPGFTNGELTRHIIMQRAGTNVKLTATRTAGGTQTGSSNAFAVNNPVPAIASITPDTANMLDTLTISITGRNFIDSVTNFGFVQGFSFGTPVIDDTSHFHVLMKIDTTAVPGSNNLTVNNAPPGGGVSNSIPFVVTIPAPPPPVLSGPQDSSRNNLTTVVLSWLHAPLALQYRLQLATDTLFGAPAYDDTTLTASTVTLSAPLIQNSTTYYWRVRAKNSRGWGAFSRFKSFTTLPAYPATYAIGTTVQFPTHQTQGEYLSSDYRIVGLPGDPARGGARLDQLLSGVQNTDWVVYRDNGAPQNYFESFSNSTAFNLSPGRAFWVLKKGTWTINSLSVPTAALDTPTYSVRIPLQSNWNLITNPLNIPVSWSTIQSVNGGFPDPIFKYTGTFDSSASFVPYGGYYFYNSRGLSFLKIPFGSTSSSLQKSRTVKGDWRIGIELASDGHVDRSVTFGVDHAASAGFDSLEYRKPRAFSDIATVYFNRPDWDPQYSGFAADFRPSVESLESWKFEVHGKLRSQMTLRFNGVDAVPADLKVYLIDEQRAKYLDLRTGASYTFAIPTGGSEFNVIVGQEGAVQAMLNSVLPKEFALGNNFPNPFNPATTIPVSIPRNADVTLKVYNLLGEEVRTVFAGTLEPGRYFYTWDGKNNTGNTVASGIYFTRFRAANGPAFVTKMIMLK